MTVSLPSLSTSSPNLLARAMRDPTRADGQHWRRLMVFHYSLAGPTLLGRAFSIFHYCRGSKLSDDSLLAQRWCLHLCFAAAGVFDLLQFGPFQNSPPKML